MRQSSQKSAVFGVIVAQLAFSSGGMVASCENPSRCGSRRAGLLPRYGSGRAALRACGVAGWVRAARDAGCLWDANPSVSLALGS